MNGRKQLSLAIHDTCPRCGSGSTPLLWATCPNTGTRTYRCRDCGGRWSVEGTQEELLSVEVTLRLEFTTGGKRR